MKKCLGVIGVLLFTFSLCFVNAWAEDMTTMPDEAMQKAPEAQVPATMAETPAKAVDVLDTADALMTKGGLDNCKKALDICLKNVMENPNDYRANWMAAMSCREYANEVKKTQQKGWEDVCKEYGKKGMGFAEKAVQINPNRAEGHYWYGMNVGIYSDGVSILTALREGLKDKTQNSFETAYKIDKNYDKAGVIVALGRFWQVLPWPLNDEDKSMEYYREFQKTKYAKDPDSVEFNVYFAELLMDSRKTKNEAKMLLEEVPKMSKDKYWNKKAKDMLDDM